MSTGGITNELMEHNWYEVLSVSIEADETQISKAFRKMSLLYHPDKNFTDPKAPELFLLVQKAREILLDPEKRKIFDDQIRSIAKRKEYDSHRDKNMDERRKKMKQDLENRMKEATSSSSSSSSSATSSRTVPKSTSQTTFSTDHLNKMRQENQAFREEFSKSQSTYDHEQRNSKESFQIKVKWRKSQQSHSDDSLYQMFKRFGEIEHIDVAAHSGIITFKDSKSCYPAIDAFVGSPNFRVSALISEYVSKEKPNIFTHHYSDQKSQSSTKYVSSIETMLADDIRRAVEREKLLRQMQSEQDELESNGIGMVKESRQENKYRDDYDTSDTNGDNANNVIDKDDSSKMKKISLWDYFDLDHPINMEELESMEKRVFSLVDSIE